MNEDTCQNCNCNLNQGYVLTFKTPNKTCTVALDDVDMMLHEVLDELVVPAIEGVGYVVKPGHIDVFYREE